MWIFYRFTFNCYIVLVVKKTKLNIVEFLSTCVYMFMLFIHKSAGLMSGAHTFGPVTCSLLAVSVPVCDFWITTKIVMFIEDGSCDFKPSFIAGRLTQCWSKWKSGSCAFYPPHFQMLRPTPSFDQSRNITKGTITWIPVLVMWSGTT